MLFSWLFLLPRMITVRKSQNLFLMHTLWLTDARREWSRDRWSSSKCWKCWQTVKGRTLCVCPCGHAAICFIRIPPWGNLRLREKLTESEGLCRRLSYFFNYNYIVLISSDGCLLTKLNFFFLNPRKTSMVWMLCECCVNVDVIAAAAPSPEPLVCCSCVQQSRPPQVMVTCLLTWAGSVSCTVKELPAVMPFYEKSAAVFFGSNSKEMNPAVMMQI